jgi:hypothetical protein
MAFDGKTLKVCNCNRTMALDAKALAAALQSGAPLTIHTELCRREVGEFGAAIAGGGECIVACTQEAPLFAELNESAGAKSELKFVNIRETAGWSAEGGAATPKIAALLALADLPAPEPVPSVSYKSDGHVLVIGPAEAAVQWAERLAGELEVSVLVPRRAAAISRSSGAIPSGRARSGRSRAGSVRSRSSGSRRTRSISTSAPGATPASAPVPRTRSTSPTRSTSTSARRTASA